MGNDSRANYKVWRRKILFNDFLDAKNGINPKYEGEEGYTLGTSKILNLKSRGSIQIVLCNHADLSDGRTISRGRNNLVGLKKIYVWSMSLKY